MFIVGEDDMSCDQTHVKILVDRMTRHHQPRDVASRCRVLRYPGAGHLIEPPYSPLCRVCYTKLVGKHASAWRKYIQYKVGPLLLYVTAEMQTAYEPALLNLLCIVLKAYCSLVTHHYGCFVSYIRNKAMWKFKLSCSRRLDLLKVQLLSSSFQFF